jgi:hypothetical protein
MYPRVIWAVTLSLVLASCAASSDASPAAVDDAKTPVPSTAPAADITLAPESTPDLGVFIAAINEAAVGTTYEDAALDDPEVFIGVGHSTMAAPSSSWVLALRAVQRRSRCWLFHTVFCFPGFRILFSLSAESATRLEDRIGLTPGD